MVKKIMAKNKRPALGKGLSSLMALDTVDNEEQTSSKDGFVELPIEKVVVNPFQPRVDFDEESIKELAISISEQGLLQPIVVRRSGEYYQIISGERRFRAMGSLSWKSIPVIVREDVNDRKMLELALVENIQRENLNEIEKAVSYQRLLDDCGLSHQDLSDKLGKSRSAITNTIRLLKLPEDIQHFVRSKELSMGHARALLAIENESDMLELAKEVISNSLSVRETEKLVSQGKKPEAVNVKDKVIVSESVKEFSKQWSDFAGIKVKINSRSNGAGKIEIPYKSEEELASLTSHFLLGN